MSEKKREVVVRVEIPGEGAIASVGNSASNDPCPGCNSVETERSLEFTDDFFEDFQRAYHSTARTPEEGAFLAFLSTELPTLANVAFDTSRIWIEYRNAQNAATNCRSLYVGESALPQQTRTHKHSNTDYRFETRSQRKTAYIDFCHPSIDEIWDDVRGCAIAAAIAAVVAAILTDDPNTGKELFYPSFYACLVSRIGDRAREVTVDMHATTEVGCWKYHCP